MKPQTATILKFMQVLTWVFFIGLCIRTGILIFTTLFTLFIKPEGANNLFEGLNLSGLFTYSKGHFSGIMLLIIISSTLRAYLCYWVIQIFRELNLVHPFSEEIRSFIANVSLIALLIGVLNYSTRAYASWLGARGISTDKLGNLYEGGAEFVFFAGIIYIIALVFRKGIDIQTENELTV